MKISTDTVLACASLRDKTVRGAFILALLLLPATTAAKDPAALWSALAKGGHVALMRHAIAPGIGDPEHFRLGDCSTQRNLDDAGRAQARRTGDAFRRNRVAVARVLSSEWCRCVETAVLLKLANVETFPALNSFFEARQNERGQTEAVRSLLSRLDPAAPSVVMATHRVNITALTGKFPQSGEIVVLRLGGPDAVDVVGTIPAQ